MINRLRRWLGYRVTLWATRDQERSWRSVYGDELKRQPAMKRAELVAVALAVAVLVALAVAAVHLVPS